MLPTLHYLTFTDPSELARPRHMAYWEWGDPANPKVAVCAHGLSRNGRDFDSLARVLSAHYRVICPDMAGRGKSSWLSNKSDYTYTLYMADVLALFSQLALKDVTWIGTSMGGIIGMMLAAMHQKHIKAMVLNDVGSIVSAEGLRRILGYVGLGGLFNDREAAMAYLKSVLLPFAITREDQWEQMFDISFVALPGGRYAIAYDPEINQPFRDAVSKSGEIADVDLTPVWNEVKCPVLLLRGEHSDILPRPAAEAMAQRPEPVKFIEIKGVGHAPALLDESQIGIIVDWAKGGA